MSTAEERERARARAADGVAGHHEVSCANLKFAWPKPQSDAAKLTGADRRRQYRVQAKAKR